jgi:hypothetical protein
VGGYGWNQGGGPGTALAFTLKSRKTIQILFRKNFKK